MSEKFKLSKEKFFDFNAFDHNISQLEEGDVNFNSPVSSYNFCYEKGRLRAGYGVRDIQMPTSREDLKTEEVIPIVGSALALWNFAWYEKAGNELKYYLFYFNDKKQLCYDNLFGLRPLRLFLDTDFVSTPVGINYQIGGDDCMIFSAPDCDTFVFGDAVKQTLPNAPRLISLCAHEDRLFAITAEARRALVYSDNLNIMEWNDEESEHLVLSDDRGNLTKVLSFGDYLYVFREFGITRVSIYSASRELNISHIFESSSYIYPGSIASDGEKIYFMTRDGFYSFNGSSARKINLQINVDNVNCSATCFEGRYYLACRIDFDDEKIGCEEGEFVNNALLVFDTASEKTEILRGIDVKQVLAMNNPLKSKVVLCFNGEMSGHIGELVADGEFFGAKCHRLWESPLSDFGLGCDVKVMTRMFIKSNCDCKVTFISDRDRRVINITAQEGVQEHKVHLVGRRFKVRIETEDSGAEISNFRVGVRC